MFRRLKAWIAPIALIVIAFWSLWPQVVEAGSVVTEGYDGVLAVWILNQTIQKIPLALGKIFEGNIFFPYKHSLAYSDLLVPSAFLGFLPVKLTNLPVLAANIALISGQVLTALVVYAWWKEMGGNRWSAFLGTVALILSQIRMHYFAHLQMWIMQWWLISAWMIWRFRKNGKIWQLYLAGMFLVIQVWESILPVYWILLVSGALLWPKRKELIKKWRHLAIIGAIVVLLTLPVLNTYLNISREFNYVRPIREAAHFSLSVEESWGKFLSPGLYVLFALALLSLSPRRWLNSLLRGGAKENFRWLMVILGMSLIMALGPVLKWQGNTFKALDKYFIPLPYAVFYYIIPGFKALRTPSRWIWPAAWAASGVMALGFKNYESGFKKIIIFGAVLIAIFGGIRISQVVRIPQPEDYPKVYTWLKQQEGEVVLEMPLYTWGAGEISSREVYRMLYSLEHKKKLVNGYSGFYPPPWERLAGELWWHFPSKELDEKLEDIGVDYIIVHKDEYEQKRLEVIKTWGKDKLIWQDPHAMVYALSGQ